MKNTFGSDLSLTIFGESHGRAVGAVLDGMAAGVPVDESFLAACMDKRRARGDGLSTPRVEVGCGAAAFRCGERPHHRHRHRPDDRKPEHPQRRLCQNG